MQPDPELTRILLRAFPLCRIEACAELNGGVSARAVVVDLAFDDAPSKRVVVRRPTRDTPEEARAAARREHQLLLRCAELGMLAPQAYALDSETAAVVVEYIVGAPEFQPSDESAMLATMARQLARIHAFGPVGSVGFLLPRADRYEYLLRTPEHLDHNLGESRVRSALGGLWPWPQHNADTLLHGDYWPGNLLWNADQLVAVLDWEDAAVGDPLADISIARLDILWAFGAAAMHAFTEHYRAHTQLDWRNLARWDLSVSLRPMSNLARWAPSYAKPPICRPDITELTMQQGHRYFVDQALKSLGLGDDDSTAR